MHTKERPAETQGGEDDHLQAKESGLGRKRPCRHFDLGLLAFKIMRKYPSVVSAFQSVVL